MRKRKSKMVDAEVAQKQSSPLSKQTKKISLGKIVQKTVEILKKPFSRNSSVEKNGDDGNEASTNKSAPKQPRKPKTVEKMSGEKERDSKPKFKRKKESISIDYPSSSLKKLEEDKAKKTKTNPRKTKKRKPSKQEFEVMKDDFDEDNWDQSQSSGRSADLASISTEVNGFFYTNDKFITRFEDEDILDYLKMHYPLFMKDQFDFQTQKKQILDMLQNAQFMDQLLSYYDINIYEFFGFLFRLEPDLFKGSFLKKVQKAMRYKKYAIKAKRCSHAERRRARLKQLKQVDARFQRKVTTSSGQLKQHRKSGRDDHPTN